MKQRAHTPKYNLGTEVFIDANGNKSTVSNILRNSSGDGYIYHFHGTSIKRGESYLISLQEQKEVPLQTDMVAQIADYLGRRDTNSDKALTLAAQLEDGAMLLREMAQEYNQLKKEFQNLTNEYIKVCEERDSYKTNYNISAREIIK